MKNDERTAREGEVERDGDAALAMEFVRACRENAGFARELLVYVLPEEYEAPERVECVSGEIVRFGGVAGADVRLSTPSGNLIAVGLVVVCDGVVDSRVSEAARAWEAGRGEEAMLVIVCSCAPARHAGNASRYRLERRTTLESWRVIAAAAGEHAFAAMLASAADAHDRALYERVDAKRDGFSKAYGVIVGRVAPWLRARPWAGGAEFVLERVVRTGGAGERFVHDCSRNTVSLEVGAMDVGVKSEDFGRELEALRPRDMCMQSPAEAGGQGAAMGTRVWVRVPEVDVNGRAEEQEERIRYAAMSMLRLRMWVDSARRSARTSDE